MMNKEDVLIVEFKPIFHKWGMKISYQDFSILKRGIFKDEELKVYSSDFPDYDSKSNTLFVKGLEKDKDDNIIYLYEEDKLRIEEKIKLFNEKHFTFRLPRVRKEDNYYFMQSDFIVGIDKEIGDEIDDRRHNVGNYFFTGEEAMECLEYLKKCLINWHREKM